MSIQITDAIMVQGLNKAFLGLGYQVSSNFSVADAQYNFGKIETSSLEFISNSYFRESNTANLSGVNFDVGAVQSKLNRKTNMYSSLNYAFREHLTSQNTRNCSL
jgi:hypothetical protein